MLKVLVACEESQRVCTAFRERGFEAYSADIQEPSGGHPDRMPPYTQTIQPYEYGHPYSKKTCLWLKGLTKLKPTNVLTEYKPYVSCGTSHNKGNKDKAGVSRSGGAAKVRSKTFEGIARAMAQQWGDYLLGKTDRQLSLFEEDTDAETNR